MSKPSDNPCAELTVGSAIQASVEEANESSFVLPEWRRFAGMALVFVIVYGIIVSVVVLAAGETAGAIVGPSLMVLLGEVIRRLEWRTSNSRWDGTPVPRIVKVDPPQFATADSGLWYFFTLTLAIVGLQFLLGILAGLALALYGVWEGGKMAGPHNDTIALLSSTAFEVGLVVMICFAYFTGGFLCGKTATSIRYGHAVFSALAACLIDAAPLAVILFLVGDDGSMALSTLAPLGLFSLLYVLMTVAGTRLGSKRSISQSIVGSRAQNTS